MDKRQHTSQTRGNVLESVHFKKISILTRNSLWFCFVPQNDQRSFFILGSLESLNHISKRCPDVPNKILYCFRLQWHAWIVRRSYCWNSFESQKKGRSKIPLQIPTSKSGIYQKMVKRTLLSFLSYLHTTNPHQPLLSFLRRIIVANTSLTMQFISARYQPNHFVLDKATTKGAFLGGIGSTKKHLESCGFFSYILTSKCFMLVTLAS